MESFNDLYDIESPRTSEKKITFIENSIHNSLLHNNEDSSIGTWFYGVFLHALIWITAIGLIAIVVVIVLLSMRKLH